MHLGAADELATAARFAALLGAPARPPPGHATRTLPGVLLRGDCAYALRHWRAALARRWRGWEVFGAGATAAEAAGAAAVLDEYEALDWAAVLAPPFRVASSFLVRKGLGRKAALADALRAHAARCGAACPLARAGAVPETACIDTFAAFHARPRWLDAASALAECVADAEALMARGAPGDLFILKPSVTNKGAGIALVGDAGELARALAAERDIGTWVLQAYVRAPLLLPPRAAAAAAPAARHKFHVRVYALAVGALDVFVFREALLLFAPRPYAGAARGDAGAHITNSCVGAAAGGADWDARAHVRTLSELPALMAAAGAAPAAAAAAAAAAFAGMCASIAHAFAALEGDVAGLAPAPASFELYGVDFLLDDAAAPVLLEFNPTPDVAQTGARLDGVIAALTEAVAREALDARCAPAPRGAAAAAGSIVIAPPGGAPALAVRTAPRAAPGAARAGAGAGAIAGAGADWAPGCSGADHPALDAGGRAAAAAARARGDSGMEHVYSRLWPMAHGGHVCVT
jgi:hypothetical protein